MGQEPPAGDSGSAGGEGNDGTVEGHAGDFERHLLEPLQVGN